MPKSKNFMTRPYRATFIKLDVPGSYQNAGVPKYSLRLLIPKTEKVFLKELTEYVMEQVNATNWTKQQKDAAIKASLKDKTSDYFLIRDGDERPDYLGHEGHFYLNLRRHHKLGVPQCYDSENKPVPAAFIKDRFYNGCWVICSIQTYCYDKPRPGVSLTLRGVQFVKDDAPFMKSDFTPLDNIDGDTGIVDEVSDEDIPI